MTATDWYTCEMNRRDRKPLMRRSDRPGLIRFGVYVATLLGTGALAYLSLGTPWAVPAFALYGCIVCFATAIAHETHHGTAFRTHWLNETVHLTTGLLCLREPQLARWEHAVHHSRTLERGPDPEIAVPNPVSPMQYIAGLVGLGYVGRTLRAFGHALGILDDGFRTAVPESQQRRAILGARIFAGYIISVTLLSIALGSWLPLLFTVLARFYGSPLPVLIGFTQHAGLPENVNDHRLNSRTLHLNPLFAFFYWNMHYHVEHHIYPQVPFHALPALHEKVKGQLPPQTAVYGTPIANCSAPSAGNAAIRLTSSNGLYQRLPSAATPAGTPAHHSRRHCRGRGSAPR